MRYKEGQRVAYTGNNQGHKQFFNRYNADYRNLKIIKAERDGFYKVGISESISLFFDDKVLRSIKNNIKKL